MRRTLAIPISETDLANSNLNRNGEQDLTHLLVAVELTTSRYGLTIKALVKLLVGFNELMTQWAK